MKKSLFGVVVGAGLIALSVSACSSADESNISKDSASDLGTTDTVQTKAVCEGAGARFHCLSHVVVGSNGIRKMATGPSGLGAKDLQAAYGLDTSVDPGATVAIIDAFGYAKAEADLAVYRNQYGLGACTVASGCLTIVNQDGNTSPLPPNPPSNDDWTLETALDLDMASAACPKCKILLVQSNNDQDEGLFLAQATAARLGATVISNSWGLSETAADPVTDYEHFFATPGAGIFVAAGDSGYDNGGQGPDYPSTSAYVTAVGGTNLKKSASGGTRGWVEKAWGGSFFGGAGGSACGLTVPKPSWQANVSTACSFRAASDVAAVGDPATGPAIYNAGAWQQIGGTSAASPLVAAIYALTGHGKDAPSFAYKNTAAFYDVTSGSNGSCGNVLCKSAAGWDGPTGNGTPNGAALKTTTGTADCTGKTCGNDGIGGSCGTCGDAQYCSAEGSCVAQCVPVCTGKTCGEDGCGGSCGDCTSSQTCSAAGACVASSGN